MKTLRHLDIFGNMFNFTINKELKYRTNMGALFSIITLFVIIITCIFFGADFYYRTNPKVLSQITVPENHTMINLTTKNLTISWRIEDMNGHEIQFGDAFYISVLYYGFEDDSETKELISIHNPITIPVKRCNETNFNDNFNTFNSPEQWYCLDFDQLTAPFGGSWDSNFLYYFTIMLTVCEYDKEGNRTGKCSNLKKLKDFLGQRVFFSMLLPYVHYAFTDYYNPLKIEYKNYYLQLNQNLIRADICKFDFPLLKDDRGWIFNDYISDTALSIKACEKNYLIRFDNDYEDESMDDYFYGIDFYLDKSHPYYIRTYMKFQDLSAIVGGFVKIVTLIFSFLNFYCNSYQRDNFIVNYFFDLYDEENLNAKNRKNIKKITNRNTNSCNYVISINQVRADLHKKNLPRLNMMKQKNDKVTLKIPGDEKSNFNFDQSINSNNLVITKNNFLENKQLKNFSQLNKGPNFIKFEDRDVNVNCKNDIIMKEIKNDKYHDKINKNTFMNDQKTINCNSYNNIVEEKKCNSTSEYYCHPNNIKCNDTGVALHTQPNFLMRKSTTRQIDKNFNCQSEYCDIPNNQIQNTNNSGNIITKNFTGETKLIPNKNSIDEEFRKNIFIQNSDYILNQFYNDNIINKDFNYNFPDSQQEEQKKRNKILREEDCVKMNNKHNPKMIFSNKKEIIEFPRLKTKEKSIFYDILFFILY